MQATTSEEVGWEKGQALSTSLIQGTRVSYRSFCLQGGGGKAFVGYCRHSKFASSNRVTHN